MLIDILGLTFKPFPSYPIQMITDLHCFTSPGLTSQTHLNFIQFLFKILFPEQPFYLLMNSATLNRQHI